MHNIKKNEIKTGIQKLRMINFKQNEIKSLVQNCVPQWRSRLKNELSQLQLNIKLNFFLGLFYVNKKCKSEMRNERILIYRENLRVCI